MAKRWTVIHPCVFAERPGFHRASVQTSADGPDASHARGAGQEPARGVQMRTCAPRVRDRVVDLDRIEDLVLPVQTSVASDDEDAALVDERRVPVARNGHVGDARPVVREWVERIDVRDVRVLTIVPDPESTDGEEPAPEGHHGEAMAHAREVGQPFPAIVVEVEALEGRHGLATLVQAAGNVYLIPKGRDGGEVARRREFCRRAPRTTSRVEDIDLSGVALGVGSTEQCDAISDVNRCVIGTALWQSVGNVERVRAGPACREEHHQREIASHVISSFSTRP